MGEITARERVISKGRRGRVGTPPTSNPIFRRASISRLVLRACGVITTEICSTNVCRGHTEDAQRNRRPQIVGEGQGGSTRLFGVIFDAVVGGGEFWGDHAIAGITCCPYQRGNYFSRPTFHGRLLRGRAGKVRVICVQGHCGIGRPNGRERLP